MLPARSMFHSHTSVRYSLFTEAMWKYQELLNTDLTILLTIACGLISVVKQYVFRRGESSTLNKLIFKFLLPASVVQG